MAPNEFIRADPSHPREPPRAWAGQYPYLRRRRPAVQLLSAEAVGMIGGSAETILEEIGIGRRRDPQSLRLWRPAGAPFPRGLVPRLSATVAPRAPSWCAPRSPRPCVGRVHGQPPRGCALRGWRSRRSCGHADAASAVIARPVSSMPANPVASCTEAPLRSISIAENPRHE
ncbi:MAG: hypothetical protein HIU85_05880 [Proteobacteria bacterium]|nr:hypothetical protein [Pseudomonadota bacterium]